MSPFPDILTYEPVHLRFIQCSYFWDILTGCFPDYYVVIHYIDTLSSISLIQVEPDFFKTTIYKIPQSNCNKTITEQF